MYNGQTLYYSFLYYKLRVKNRQTGTYRELGEVKLTFFRQYYKSKLAQSATVDVGCRGGPGLLDRTVRFFLLVFNKPIHFTRVL